MEGGGYVEMSLVRRILHGDELVIDDCLAKRGYIPVHHMNISQYGVALVVNVHGHILFPPEGRLRCILNPVDSLSSHSPSHIRNENRPLCQLPIQGVIC